MMTVGDLTTDEGGMMQRSDGLIQCEGCGHLFSSWYRLRRHILYRMGRLKP